MKTRKQPITGSEYGGLISTAASFMKQKSGSSPHPPRSEIEQDTSARRAGIQCLASLGIVLLLEQLLLPYSEVTLSRLGIATVLLYCNLWWLLFGLIHVGSSRR
jgi:hypothetical protein